MRAKATKWCIKLYYILRNLDHVHVIVLIKALDVSISTIRLGITCLALSELRNSCFELFPNRELTVDGLHERHIEVFSV